MEVATLLNSGLHQPRITSYSSYKVFDTPLQVSTLYAWGLL